jgi:hypothetical protein
METPTPYDWLDSAINAMVASVNEYRDRMLRSRHPELRAAAEARYRESRLALAVLFQFSREAYEWKSAY